MRPLAVLALVALVALPTASAGFAFPAESRPTVGPVAPYHNWPLATAELRDIASEYPELARLHSAGKSHNGLDLWVLEITNFETASPPIAERPVLWFDGATHGNEQLGGELAWEIIYFLLDEYESNETAKWIVDNRHVYVMPLVNPDGNAVDARFNGRGVNINRNWPAGWGELNENLVFNNPGAYPASEPETRAIIDFISKMPVKPDYFNSFHTGVVLFLYPWGYKEDLPVDDGVYARICAEVWPGDDRCGPTYSTIYPASGVAVDWGYEALGAISWTYEVHDDQFTLAQTGSVRETLAESWKGVEHALLHVDRYGARLVVSEARLVEVGDGFEFQATVVNDGYGPALWADVGLALPGASGGAVRIGRLDPGAAVSVAVPVAGSVAAGEGAVELAYPKRIHLAPMAEVAVPLLISDAGGRLTLERVGDLETSSVVEGQGALDVPGAGLLAALASVGVAFALRRKRA